MWGFVLVAVWGAAFLLAYWYCMRVYLERRLRQSAAHLDEIFRI